MEEKEINQLICDVIMGRPYGFSVGKNHFYLYPPSLGKIYLLQRLVENLEINFKLLQKDVNLEALRLAKEKKDECLTMICYHTIKNPEEIFNALFIANRKKLLADNLSEEDIAALMIILLTSDKTHIFINHLGIDKEQERMSKVMKVKDNKNSIIFGGKSIFGNLLDTACERYGWTKEYVVWGIDYTSLRLMLDDKVNSVYVSDDELKKLPANITYTGDEDIINPNKENIKTIMNMDWK